MSTFKFNTIMCFEACFPSFFNMLVTSCCIVIFDNEDTFKSKVKNLKSFIAFSKMWVPAVLNRN